MNEVEVFKDSKLILQTVCSQMFTDREFHHVSPEFTAVSHIVSFGVDIPSDAHLGDVPDWYQMPAYPQGHKTIPKLPKLSKLPIPQYLQHPTASINPVAPYSTINHPGKSSSEGSWWMSQTLGLATEKARDSKPTVPAVGIYCSLLESSA